MADQVPQDNNSTEAAAAELPAKIRVHALAKLLGLTSKQVIAKAAEFGHELRSAHSTLHRDAAEQVRDALIAPAPAEVEPAPVEEAAPEAAPEPQAEAAPEPEAEAAPEPDLAGPGSLFTAPVQETPLFEAPQAAAPTEQAADAPLFLQPELTPPAEATPRRRRTRRGAEAPAEPVAETTEAEEATTEEAPAETTTESDDEHPRRRRRGRRGRGRGRGENADGSESAEDEEGEADKSGAAEAEGEKGKAEPERTAETTEAPAAEGAEGEETAEADEHASDEEQGEGTSRRRRRRRRRKGSDAADTGAEDDSVPTVIHEREPRSKSRAAKDEVQGISGSTRLEAKRQRRRDGREAGRRRPPILTESEFLARREAVDRVMVVREKTDGAHAGMTQVAVLEDGILVEHFVTSANSASMVGNVYLGRVQNVLPSMEAAFIDIGRGRNGVLYAGEVNWEAAGLGGNSRKIEQALKPGDQVVVQVSKDPVGHKGARLTTQISLAGRFLVYVPGGSSTGISRKLPDTERKRLKEILREIVPAEAGVIIRTAAEGVAEDELSRDVTRLQTQWAAIEEQAAKAKSEASGQPKTLYEEPDLLVKVVRDLFNEDFSKLVIEGEKSWSTVENYIRTVASDLLPRVEQYNSGNVDVFGAHRIDEQLAKALDRKVWLPSGGTLVIDRTEAMTVVDVNTGKFTGSGGNLEETVTRNNLEAAEEIVRQMRLRDIGGMIVVDFIDMVLESNRDLVLRRLTEALGRDRTRHQVSEVTSLGLVQMTRKRLGTGLVEAFSTTCEHCHGRGIIVHSEPIESKPSEDSGRSKAESGGSRRKRNRDRGAKEDNQPQPPQQQPQAEPAANHHATPEEAAARRAHPVALAMAAHHTPDGGAEHGAAADAEHAAEPVAVAAETEPVAEAVVTESAEQATPEVTETPTEPEAAALTPEPVAETPEPTEAETPEPAAAGAPRRRRARRVSRAAAAPADSEGSGTVFVIPTPPVTETPAVPAPAVATAAEDTATTVVARRPRRRRAAGRPAGPPVDAEA